MSSIPNGGSGITISPKQTRGFTLTWNDGGWHGITLVQPQPTSPPGVTLDYNENAVNFNEGNGTYGFNYSITNPGGFVVTFNVQYSSI